MTTGTIGEYPPRDVGTVENLSSSVKLLTHKVESVQLKARVLAARWIKTEAETKTKAAPAPTVKRTLDVKVEPKTECSKVQPSLLHSDQGTLPTCSQMKDAAAATASVSVDKSSSQHGHTTNNHRQQNVCTIGVGRGRASVLPA